jgi:hypothetical protein
MKSFLAASAAVLTLITTASADWIIDAKIESPQMTSGMVMKIKGDKIRADITSGPAGPLSSIIDSATGESITLLHAQKMAMKSTGDQVKQAVEMAKKFAGGPSGPSTVKPKPTGQKEKVGDYECEIWTWAEGNLSTRYWISSNHPQAAVLKDLEKKMRKTALGASQIGPDTTELAGVPLKTESDSNGSKTTMSINSVKEAAVEAKDFETPADYQSMAMPSFPTAPPAK